MPFWESALQAAEQSKTLIAIASVHRMQAGCVLNQADRLVKNADMIDAAQYNAIQSMLDDADVSIQAAIAIYCQEDDSVAAVIERAAVRLREAYENGDQVCSSTSAEEAGIVQARIAIAMAEATDMLDDKESKVCLVHSRAIVTSHIIWRGLAWPMCWRLLSCFSAAADVLRLVVGVAKMLVFGFIVSLLTLLALRLVSSRHIESTVEDAAKAPFAQETGETATLQSRSGKSCQPKRSGAAARGPSNRGGAAVGNVPQGFCGEAEEPEEEEEEEEEEEAQEGPHARCDQGWRWRWPAGREALG